jgi:16S rRNA processing protein RimM
MAEEPRERRLTMGRFGAPYGVRGWLRIHSHTSPPENLFRYSPWWVRLNGQWVMVRADEGRPHGKGLIAHIEGYDDPESARRLVGIEIVIERDRLEPPGEGVYYWADLIGATVVNLAGQTLGKVDHLFNNGAHDVMVVAGERERLIPFVRGPYVVEVDVEGGRIRVDWDPED